MLNRIVNDWNLFRHALRKEDREAFEELMAKARKHASAAGYDARVNPMESFFMSIILEMEKELEELKARFEEHAGMDN
jgi:flagellar biosynthesis/type III secretory pathway protein FliH